MTAIEMIVSIWQQPQQRGGEKGTWPFIQDFYLAKAP